MVKLIVGNNLQRRHQPLRDIIFRQLAAKSFESPVLIVRPGHQAIGQVEGTTEIDVHHGPGVHRVQLSHESIQLDGEKHQDRVQEHLQTMKDNRICQIEIVVTPLAAFVVKLMVKLDTKFAHVHFDSNVIGHKKYI